MISFGATVKVSPQVALMWDDKTAEALEEATKKHLPILDGVDLDLEFRAPGKIDMQMKRNLVLQSIPKGEVYYTKYGVDRRKGRLLWPVTPFLGFLYAGSIETFLKFKKGSPEHSWNGTRFFLSGLLPWNAMNERINSFVKRAFTEIAASYKKDNLPKV